MATIRSRGSGRWQIQAYLGRGPDGRRRFTARTITGTKADAKRAATALQAEVDAGKIRPTDDLTLGQLVEKWTHHRAPGWSPKYATEVRGVTDRHLGPLADVRIDRLRPADLDTHYGRLLRQPVGASTIETLHRRLHAALAQAVRWDLIATNPAERAQPPRPPRSRAQAARPAQIGRVLADLDPMMATWVRLAATTGARRGEIAALQWDDIDLDTGTVLFQRAVVEADGELVVKALKVDRPKGLALDQGTVAALQTWRQAHVAMDLRRGVRSPWVFPGIKHRGLPIRPGIVSKRWQRLGLGVRLHDLRHGVGTAGMEAGFTPMQVAARLGHARSSTTTDLYGHHSPASDRELAEVLGGALDEALGLGQ